HDRCTLVALLSVCATLTVRDAWSVMSAIRARPAAAWQEFRGTPLIPRSARKLNLPMQRIDWCGMAGGTLTSCDARRGVRVFWFYRFVVARHVVSVSNVPLRIAFRNEVGYRVR